MLACTTMHVHVQRGLVRTTPLVQQDGYTAATAATQSSMHCNLQQLPYTTTTIKSISVALPRRHVPDAVRASSYAQEQPHHQQLSWQQLQLEQQPCLCSSGSGEQPQIGVEQQGFQLPHTHVRIEQVQLQSAHSICKQPQHQQEQQQQQHTLLCQNSPVSPLMLQQQQQTIAVTDSAVRSALQLCSSWTALANYLLQDVQAAYHQHQQQHPPLQADAKQSNTTSSTFAGKRQRNTQPKQLLWQKLNGHQARLVVQHAAQLAARQQRHSAQTAIPPDVVAGLTSLPSKLQQPLALLLRRAVLRAAASPGNAVEAAALLRAVWRLAQQQWNEKAQQQLGQQLLGIMCAGHYVADMSVAAAAAAVTRQQRAPVQNANLLADVAQSIIQLQLQPNNEWLEWFQHTSLAMLQQQQNTKHTCASSYFFVSTLCCASYVHVIKNPQPQQQQQEHAVFPNSGWLQSWAAAAAQLAHPFSNAQLLQVMSAARQLQLQLPSSFWQTHLSEAAVRSLPAQQLLLLLVHLPSLQQHRGQHLPAAWRAAAAEALLSAAVDDAAAGAVPLLPRAVAAAYQLQLPLQQGHMQQLLQVLLESRGAGPSVGGAIDSSSSGTTTSSAIPEPTSTNSSSSLLSRTTADAAAAAVFAVAQMSILHPPPTAVLAQLQLQLLPKLHDCSMKTLVGLLWVFAVKWRVRPPDSWLSRLLAATEPLLACSSPSQLRMLIVGLSLLQVPIPEAWMQSYLQATAEAMGCSHESSNSSVVGRDGSSNVARPDRPQQHQWQQQQHMPSSTTRQKAAAFLGNVAYSLVQLGVLPCPAWQRAWQRAVSQQAQLMSPDQLIDALYAAAVWSDSQLCLAEGAVAVAAATEAAASAYAVPSGAGTQPAVQAATSVGSSNSSSVVDARGRVSPVVTRQNSPALPHLLPKPQLRWVENTSRSSFAPLQASATTHPAGQASQKNVLQGHTQPSAAWARVLLQQLRQQLPNCTPTHLTTALWCLRRLQHKASVAWLDAVYDALLAQLYQCSMLQLQQLLRSLQHQGHILAPARIDTVLDAALVLLLKGRAHCSEHQLVWLLQLVVLLHHEPEPEWTKQVAAAAEHMLCSSSTESIQQQHAMGATSGRSDLQANAEALPAGANSSSTSGWSPGLLVDLLDGISQLEAQDLPTTWAASYRKAARRCLSHFTGLQLARLLSAAALLRWKVPAPFLQLLLRQLQLHMHCMDVHALGLVGVAVGQMGLLMGPRWVRQYMARVQQLVRGGSVKLPVADVGNMQRSVQYLRWCGWKWQRSLQCRASNRSIHRLRFSRRLKRCKTAQ